MQPYVISLAAGLLVGVIYALLNVRSPAPPLIALVGLLGMVMGEQLLPVAKRLASRPITAAWIREECVPHVLGGLPIGRSSTLAGGVPSAPTQEEG